MKTIALLLICLATTTTAMAQDRYRSRDRGYSAFWSPYSMVVIPSFIPMEVPSQKLNYFQVDPLSGIPRSTGAHNSDRSYRGYQRSSDCYAPSTMPQQAMGRSMAVPTGYQGPLVISNPFYTE